MAKTIYTIALGFNYRQRKSVLKFNGYKFIRQGKAEQYIRGEFAKWVNSKGMRLKGLVIRRQWEADRYYGKEA